MSPMISNRKLLWFSFAVIILSTLGIAVWLYQTIYFDPNEISYHWEGQQDAKKDMQRGEFRIKDTITDSLKDRIYSDTLEQYSGFSRDKVNSDSVPKELEEYIRGYNEVMVPAVESHFGTQVLEQIRHLANEEFEKRTEAEQYNVYTVLFNEIGANRQISLVIDSETWDRMSNLEPDIRGRYSLEDYINEFTPPHLAPLTQKVKQAIEDYKAKNEVPERLKPIFNIRAKYLLLGRTEYRRFFAGAENLIKQWERYYKKYPNAPGYLSVSRVGFNREMTEALVYIELHCGSLCADGRFKMLGKEKEGWRIKQEIQFYAS